MDTSAWLGLSWLGARYYADADDTEDAHLWLVGDDDGLLARSQKRKRDLVVAGGGEVG